MGCCTVEREDVIEMPNRQQTFPNRQPDEPNCCCCGIKISAIIIVYLQLACVLFVLGGGAKAGEGYFIQICNLLLIIICGIFVHIGIMQDSPYWLIPMMIYDCLGVILAVVMLIMFLDKQNSTFVLIFIILFAVFVVILCVISIFVMVRCFKYMKSNRNRVTVVEEVAIEN